MDTNMLEMERPLEHGAHIKCEFVLDAHDEEIGVWAKGHYHAEGFRREAREFALAESGLDFGTEIAIAHVNHAYWMYTPQQDGNEHNLVLIPCKPDVLGAFPVTYVQWDE